MHKTDIRSDLYSLGCTFYYLLTGQVPFTGGKVMDKLIRHGTEIPQPVNVLRPVVPAEVAAIVNRLPGQASRKETGYIRRRPSWPQALAHRFP